MTTSSAWEPAEWPFDGCDMSSAACCSSKCYTALPLNRQAAGWQVELLSYAPSDLYVSSGNINGFAAFAAWQTLHSTA